MLLSSKNGESDVNKTFEVYSSYITVASDIFKQLKALTDEGSVVEKVCLFEMRVPFSNFVRERSTRHF